MIAIVTSYTSFYEGTRS